MEVTLTWHWWYVPILVIISGHIWARYESMNNPNKGGMFPDPMPAIISVVSLIVALAITIGHYL